MKVKTYFTERGAKVFMARLQDRWPTKRFEIRCSPGLDFRTRWWVEVYVGPKWVGVGPLDA